MARDPEKQRANSRRYDAKHREIIRATKRAWNQKNKAYYRAWNLARNYGLTIDAHAALLAEQNGCCGICRKPLGTGRLLHVDHCHDTGKVRGLLCPTCNRGLGQFQDSPEVLLLAYQYLKETSA